MTSADMHLAFVSISDEDPTVASLLVVNTNHLRTRVYDCETGEVTEVTETEPGTTMVMYTPMLYEDGRWKVAASGIEAEVIDYSSGEILSCADVAMITSGSATLEAVYYGCPATILYRLSPVSYFFAKPMVVTHIGQPNIIARREIAPEFLQITDHGEAIAEAAQRFIDDEDAREEQLTAFREIRDRLLSGPKPSERAADVVLSYIP